MNEIQRSTYLLDFTFTAKKSYICKLILLSQINSAFASSGVISHESSNRRTERSRSIDERSSLGFCFLNL